MKNYLIFIPSKIKTAIQKGGKETGTFRIGW